MSTQDYPEIQWPDQPTEDVSQTFILDAIKADPARSARFSPLSESSSKSLQLEPGEETNGAVGGRPQLYVKSLA